MKLNLVEKILNKNNQLVILKNVINLKRKFLIFLEIILKRFLKLNTKQNMEQDSKYSKVII